MKKLLAGMSFALALVACGGTSEDPNLFGGATNFPFECRSLTKRTGEEWDKRCAYIGVSQVPIQTLAAGGVRVGSGPGAAALTHDVPTTPGTVRYWGGFLDNATRKLYIGSTWSDNRAVGGDPNLKNFGQIFEVDINFSSASAGNRRLVSGKILTNQGDVDVGTGDTLRTVRAIKKAADGFFYAFTMDAGNPATIVRVDPATGNRTTIWTEKTILFNNPAPFPADQCENGQNLPNTNGGRKTMQIALVGNPFEMNPVTGEFYLSIIHTSNLGGPYGIIKISADGSTCSWVTRLKATSSAVGGPNKYADSTPSNAVGYGLPNGVGPRGTGFNSMTLNSSNLYFRAVNGTNWLYASSGSSYWRTNTDTGNRELVVQSEVGDTDSIYDPSRNLLWTSGYGSGSVIVPVFLNQNPITVGSTMHCLGTTNGVPCIKGPGAPVPMLRGGLFFDPLDNNLIFANQQIGIIRYEVQTGNSYIISL
jgi:hypothetical protein